MKPYSRSKRRTTSYYLYQGVLTVKRIAHVFLAIVLSAILSSCDMHNDVKPRNQDDTRWITVDQNIFFSVMYDGDYNICLGVLKTTETVYHISLEFDYGSGLIISDYDMLKENHFLVDMNQILLRAECHFDKEKCTAKVTESFIDSISVGDKITFHLVDELPDWAEEIDEINRKACEENEEVPTTANAEE